MIILNIIIIICITNNIINTEVDALPCENVHIQKYFRNLVESTRNQIVFTIFRLIWYETDVRLIPNL